MEDAHRATYAGGAAANRDFNPLGVPISGYVDDTPYYSTFNATINCVNALGLWCRDFAI